jgi:hypothetical protein
MYLNLFLSPGCFNLQVAIPLRSLLFATCYFLSPTRYFLHVAIPLRGFLFATLEPEGAMREFTFLGASSGSRALRPGRGAGLELIRPGF